MAKQILPPGSKNWELYPDRIEDSDKISPNQLRNAKIFSSREDYSKTLTPGLRFLEIGVAWGYSAEYVLQSANPSTFHLMDTFDQDLMCWSWRKFGECKCSGHKHELLYTSETHEQYIVNLFKDRANNFKTFCGYAQELLDNIDYQYDYIYIDIDNSRQSTKDVLLKSSKLVPVGGVIGLNDYLIYDGVIEDKPYGTFQTVNEFLYNNPNWEVDAIALHNLGFYDIYLRKL